MSRPDDLPENFRPKIVKGRIFPNGRNFIYKDLASSKQVELPLSMADLVLLCDGNHTIQQILTRVFQKQRVVQFQKILDTLFLLHKRGLLENSDDMPTTAKGRANQGIWTRKKDFFTLVSGSLGSQLSSDVKSYLLMGLLILNTALISASLIFFNRYGDFHQIPATSLFWGLFFGVLLVNARSLIYFFIDSHFMTLPPSLTFRMGVKKVGFVADLEGSLTELTFHQRLLFLAGYLSLPAALSLTVFPLFLDGFSAFDQTLIVTIGFTLLSDLFPHAKNSVGKALLRELDRIPDGSDLTDFGSFLTKSNRKFKLGRSVAGLVWSLVSLGAFGLLIEAMGAHLSALSSYLSLGAGFGAILLYAHESIKGMWDHRSLSPEPSIDPKDEIIIALDLLERVSLFSEIGDTYLKALVEMSQLESIEPNKIIFREGEEPNDLYLLVSGACRVKNEYLSAEINAGSVFGESALLETGLRQATVSTETKVLVLKMPISKITEVLSQTGHLESLKSQIIVNQYFCSSKYFLNIRRSTIEKLERSGNIENLGEGVKIFNQGDVGDGIYFVVRGSVEARITTDCKAILKQGEMFGEISVLARIPRTATIVTLEPCLLFKVSNDSFWEVLLADLNFAYQIEKLSETRLSQDLDALLSLEKAS